MAHDSLLIELKARGLRDTEPRRLVINAFETIGKPAAPKDIWQVLKQGRKGIDLVTVYRILERFAQVGIAHAHPSTGEYSLCSMPDSHGHHGFLRCTACGAAEEFRSPELCMIEDAIAKKSNFSPSEHLTEIIGVCQRCA